MQHWGMPVFTRVTYSEHFSFYQGIYLHVFSLFTCLLIFFFMVSFSFLYLFNVIRVYIFLIYDSSQRY
jgi:hypothetical protein